MLRLACVLLYQGRFKSRRSGGSRIILVLCATLCSFSTSNSLVFAFSQFACVCMFVCVLCIEQGEAFQTCADTRTCVPAFLVLVLVGVVVALLVGWISVPRSHPVPLPRSDPDIITIKLGFYSTVLVSVPRLHCKAALFSMKALFFLCPTMQIGLVQWIWNFEDFCRLLSLVACAIRVGGALKMTKWWFVISCE